MSIVNGFVDWATRHPSGPPHKLYDVRNARAGLVLHSVEGWLAGAFGELSNPSRSASWTWTLGLDGVLYQHYPVTASTWASGNFAANSRYNALELEGIHTMPINEAQITTLLRLCKELGYNRAQLFEHRNVWNLASPNAGPTACPSERYAPFYAALEGGTDDMTPDEVLALGAGQFLTLLRQAIGVDDSTFDDQLGVAQIRAHLTKAGVGPHRHKTSVQQITTGEVIV